MARQLLMYQTIAIFTLAFIYTTDASAVATVNNTGSNTTGFNTTDSDARRGWFSAPNLRGTANILWSCLSTLFICVWCSIHLNVPAAGDSKFCKLLRKFKWMAVGIVAPEILVWLSANQWYEARQHSHDQQTMTQAFYANMGGFVVEKGEVRHTLNARTIHTMVSDGILDPPSLSEAEILDKSKTDYVGKAIACLQIASLLIQSIARAAKHLPITTLELSTLGYILCTFATYFFWWHKPLDVMVPTVLETTLDPDIPKPVDRIKNTDGTEQEGKHKFNSLYLIPVVSVFGGIHCIAWYFSFPTVGEQLAWRVCAVSIIVLGTILFLILRFISNDDGWSDGMLVLSVPCYILVRFYLVVEMFVGLRSVPAEVYKTVNWNTFLPIFS